MGGGADGDGPEGFAGLRLAVAEAAGQGAAADEGAWLSVACRARGARPCALRAFAGGGAVAGGACALAGTTAGRVRVPPFRAGPNLSPGGASARVPGGENRAGPRSRAASRTRWRAGGADA